MRVLRRDRTVVVEAPAKVNLFLEIHGRRSDGYHEIETLMTAVGLFDTLCFAATEGGPVQLTTRWLNLQAAEGGCCRQRDEVLDSPGRLPAADQNLVTRVLEGFRAEAGVGAGANVKLIKRIPMAAGLGGASSDAAAALVAANDVWHVGWSRDRLARFSARFGSDIPFFFSGGFAICRGRGELVEPLRPGGKLHLVVVCPPQGLSTSEVYRRCSIVRQRQPIGPIVQGLQQGRPAAVGRGMINRLQEAAESLSPWIGRMRRAFDQLDCLGHQMSGSGSSYFALCRHGRHARHLAGRLQAARLGRVFWTATVSVPHRRL